MGIGDGLVYMVGVSSVHASRLSSVHAQTAVFCTRVPCDVLERNIIL